MVKRFALGIALVTAGLVTTPIAAHALMPTERPDALTVVPFLLAQADPAAEEGLTEEELLLRKKKQRETADPSAGAASGEGAAQQAAPAEDPAANTEQPVKKRRKEVAEPVVEETAPAQPAEPDAVAAEAPVEAPRKKLREKTVDPVVVDQGTVVEPAVEPQPGEAVAEPEPAKRKKVVPAEPAVETATDPAGDEQLIREAEAILARSADLSALSDAELLQLEVEAARFSREGALPAGLRRQFRGLLGDIRQTVAARQEARPVEPQPTPEEPAGADATQTDPGAGDADLARQAQAVLDRGSAVKSMAEPDLRALVVEARGLIRNKALPPTYREPLQALLSAAREEIGLRQAGGAETPAETPAVTPDPKAGQDQAGQPADGTVPADTAATPAEGGENKAVETPVVVPEAEKKAIAFLADTTPADALDDQKLKARLETMRDMLEAGDLTRETERSLRERLKLDREALRLRVAQAEKAAAEQAAAEKAAAEKAAGEAVAGETAQAQPPADAAAKPRRKPKPGSEAETVDPFDALFKPRVVIVPPRRDERQQIIADRRPSARLEDDELIRRIQVYRELALDERLDDDQRADIADAIRLDRRELRRRLREDRESREVVLSQPTIIQQYSIHLDSGRPSAPRPPSIFVAEEDDSVVEQQLIAPPIRPIRDRVTREELLERPEAIMIEPDVRRSVPGVEIDTITFGFNEAFVREEEIADLDRIGRILEKILAARPDEVFMIEGHTDAVGSDGYNATLSRKRAQAVKEALLEYYVIDEKNLATVGLGERYLKIPTPDPEEENRRVTIRRITDLVRN